MKLTSPVSKWVWGLSTASSDSSRLRAGPSKACPFIVHFEMKTHSLDPTVEPPSHLLGCMVCASLLIKDRQIEYQYTASPPTSEAKPVER